MNQDNKDIRDVNNFTEDTENTEAILQDEFDEEELPRSILSEVESGDSIPDTESELEVELETEMESLESEQSEFVEESEVTELPSPVEAIQEDLPKEEAIEEVKPKRFNKSQRVAQIVDDEDEESYDTAETNSISRASKKKEPVSVKSLLFSLLELAVAAAIFAVIGYQLGIVYLTKMVTTIIGG